MKRLRILTVCSVVIALSIFFLKKRMPTTVASGSGLVINPIWMSTNTSPVTPEKYRRPADQTFLTFPEWYLVFSPDEQAQYYKQLTATTFPYMSHTRQIWESYDIVKQQIKGNFPYNSGYNFMIWVIGSSATVEYSIKGAYEMIIGRLTDTYQVVTDEDRFNAGFTQDYVDFIRDHPWYEFDFKRQLNTLWTKTPLIGDHFVRKLERRYILSSELLVKLVYGKLIGLGTKTVYDEAIPSTEVLVDSIIPTRQTYEVLQSYTDHSALISLPRYDRFNQAILKAALEGYSFREIAGNNSAILVSALLHANDSTTFKQAKIVFTQPFASMPSIKRVVLAVPVNRLNELLIQLKNQGIEIEHVFDY